MTYHSGITKNIRVCAVVLKDVASAHSAIKELTGSALFDRRIHLTELNVKLPDSGMPLYHWGWYASPNADIKQIKPKPPLLSPPVDTFRPVREGRRVTVDFLHYHDGQKPAWPEDLRRIYRMLHKYDICSVSEGLFYTQGKARRTAYHFYFTTRDEADLAQAVNDGRVIDGIEHTVRKYQVPLKYLGVSWDSGRKAGHFSGRDQGDASGTNFEHTQEEIFRRAILGENDRKLWVPSHTY